MESLSIRLLKAEASMHEHDTELAQAQVQHTTHLDLPPMYVQS